MLSFLSSTNKEDNESSEGYELLTRRGRKITSGEQAHISDESDSESELYSSEDDDFMGSITAVMKVMIAWTLHNTVIMHFEVFFSVHIIYMKH